MEDLSGKTFRSQNYSGKDLAGADLSNSTFICCNFDNTNLRQAKCSHSRFLACTLIDTDCRYTDFSHSHLASVFKPKDAFGMTITLECSTFRSMRTSSMWWYCFVWFAMLMDVDADKNEESPKDIMIKVLGMHKYIALKNMFRQREC